MLLITTNDLIPVVWGPNESPSRNGALTGDVVGAVAEQLHLPGVSGAGTPGDRAGQGMDMAIEIVDFMWISMR